MTETMDVGLRYYGRAKLEFDSFDPKSECRMCFECWIFLEHQYCLDKELWDLVGDNIWAHFLGVNHLLFPVSRCFSIW